MSRTSSRSSLSPSATRGASGIDLGKDSGVDMGRKARPSATSGGIGVTQEVANIGGVSVTGGVSVDVSPLAVNVSGETNAEDPNKNSISISGSVEVPGGFLGVGGGVKINTNTGEVIGGSIGAEVGGLGIHVSSSEGDVGVEFTLQIPFTPVEISLGFGFPGKKTLPPPSPGNPPVLSIPPATAAFKWSAPSIDINSVRGCTLKFTWEESHVTWNPYSGTCESFMSSPTNLPGTVINKHCKSEIRNNNGLWAMQTTIATVVIVAANTWTIESWRNQSYLNQVLDYVYFYNIPSSYTTYDWSLSDFGGGMPIVRQRIVSEPVITVFNCSAIKENPIIYAPPVVDVAPLAPFPNPPPRRKVMDTCCQENLKFLRAIYTKLGLARFPGELPSTIIQEVPNEGEEPPEPVQEPITDLVSLLDWQFRRDDERWGQWEIQINVKDSDLTKEGDQGKSVKFPNLAESVAEMEGQLLSVTTNLDALIAITTKNLVESGLARQEAIKGYLASKSIIKYMAFKSTEIDVTVPSCFTPGAETIHELIAESEIHLKGLDYTEKETLRDIFLDLLQAAAVVRAVHWQRIDTKKDTKSQLLGILKGSLDLANSIKNPTKPIDGEEKPNPAQNFEDFLDSAESGFTNTTGITDIQNPYGKTPDRRPRIRQIGDNISQAGDDN